MRKCTTAILSVVLGATVCWGQDESSQRPYEAAEAETAVESKPEPEDGPFRPLRTPAQTAGSTAPGEDSPEVESPRPTKKDLTNLVAATASKANKCAAVPCYGRPSKNPDARGRELCWAVGPCHENKGKQVRVYTNGMFASGSWYRNAKVAFPAAAEKFFDETGDKNILKQRITGYETEVTRWKKPSEGMGAYTDDHSPAPIPDEVKWTIFISGGYKWEFSHGARRDCIFGVSTLSGNGRAITVPANGSHKYKGKIICVRCPENR